jgi:hydrogenase maturation protein HypF
MRQFAMCAACAREYADPANRRFHAEPIACRDCGPRAWLERAAGAAFDRDALSTLDDVDAACTLLQSGQIVAIKGLGGFQLACDAGDAGAVARLRAHKRRERKPFALMARDLDVVRRHAVVTPDEAALLALPAAPIVILSNHTRYDGSTTKLPALEGRRPGSPHPYVIGTESVGRYLTVAAECARAGLAGVPGVQ